MSGTIPIFLGVLVTHFLLAAIARRRNNHK